ncbi:hypothetical protein [Streptomyces daliensis]|uniref:Uncharacterized protein n=1 Tax=Streptomyces daliensis TaxID=299421 RepID=A0A8T4INL8_9ACTN|nr:hypothetical protein [Streptomyces daliensis]
MAAMKKDERDTEGRGEAEDVMYQLAAALGRLGITLPSLRLDPLSYAGGRAPLVELSRCNLDTARKLTEVLNAVPPSQT